METPIYFTSPKDTSFIPEQDVEDLMTEDIYKKLMKRSTGGVTVQSNAAPAASTSFAKSKKLQRATATSPGYLAEISYPSQDDIDRRLKRRDIPKEMFGYTTTCATAAFHQGFGERSARALEREENLYQLKGSFPAALLNFSKLRARVDARQGDSAQLDRIFAAMWGLSVEEVASIPHLVVKGSEATRLSALEDRSYHALSGHPSHVGGYRVDMATITSDALGVDVPINWPRLRTTLKAIALMQTSADQILARGIAKTREKMTFKFGMDVVLDSQPQYVRGNPWETLLLAGITGDEVMFREYLRTPDDEGMSLTCALSDLAIHRAKTANMPYFVTSAKKIASSVASDSSKSLQRAISVMMSLEQGRAAADEQYKLDQEILANSQLSQTFNVPAYKVTRSTLYKGMVRGEEERMNLPDIYAMRSQSSVINLREFREAGVSLPLEIGDAIRLAVILTIQRSEIRPYAYLLLDKLKVRRTDGISKASIALRDERLYDDPGIRDLGVYLFADGFMSTLGHIFHNLTLNRNISDTGIKTTIWDYLCGRTRGSARKCPLGSWKDLIVELRTLPEGWSLYYWARISIGQMHRDLSTGIMAPIIAGEATDFLTMMKIAVQKRAQYWSSYYSGRYRNISKEIAEARYKKELEKSKEASDDPSQSLPQIIPRYIPPALRTEKDLGEIYDEDVILNRKKKFKKEQYEDMVKMQSKSKFFANIKIFTSGNKLVVGVTDAQLLDMLIEFYQARWFSLERRVNNYHTKGKEFKLGGKLITEHPWGGLVTTLPTTPDGMLEFMNDLSEIGWTINPIDLYESFRKSISEMWEDVTNEISQVVRYIEDVENDMADLQDELVDERPNLPTIKALISADPIVLPTRGFSQQKSRPLQHLTIMDKHSQTDSRIQVPASTPSETISTTDIQDTSNIKEYNGVEMSLELPDFGDDDIIVMDFSMRNEHVGTEPVFDSGIQNLLTYREIWKELGLEEISDELMRRALVLPEDKSLDEPHADQDMGPLVLRDDVSGGIRKWSRKKAFMLRRLGVSSAVELGDDMFVGDRQSDWRL